MHFENYRIAPASMNSCYENIYILVRVGSEVVFISSTTLGKEKT